MGRVIIDYPETEHSHGPITPDGAVGTAANRAVYTGPDGVLQAGTLPVAAGGIGRTTLTAGAFLRGAGAGAVALTPAADVLGLLDGVEMLTGSYTGTGTFGASSPNTLTFSKPVRMVAITTSGAYRLILVWPGTGANASLADRSINTVTWSSDRKKVSWYQANQDIQQCNGKAVRYEYFAFVG